VYFSEETSRDPRVLPALLGFGVKCVGERKKAGKVGISGTRRGRVWRVSVDSLI